MTFDPDDPKLTAFALGELDEADRRAFESLLAQSPEAARFVAEVRETAALLSGTLRKEPMPGLSIVQRLDLDARLGAVPVPSSTPRRVPVRRALFAVAASVLLTMSGFGIGFLVADRGPAAGDRAVAFTPSAMPGSIGSTLKSEVEVSEPPSAVMADGSAEAPVPELDATPEAFMRAEAGLVAEDEVSNPEAEMLAMEAVPLESSDQGFARSSPSRSKAREPRVPATAAAPSGDALPGQADAAARVAPDGFEARGGGMGGMAGGMAGMGAIRRTPDTPEAVPAARQPERSMVPPLAALAEDDAEGARLDRVRTNRPTAVVGTRGVDRRAGSNPSQAVTLQPGNVVEVVNLPEGTIAQRIELGEPIREVVVDPTGSRLLASTGDRSVAVFDLQSGQLTNSFQVGRGPVPVARFGQGGELIFSNLDAEGDQGEDSGGFLWFRADLEPLAAIPVDPGRVSMEELARRIEAEGLPIGPETLTGSLVNSPEYPYDKPEGGEPIAVDVQVVPTPWIEGNRLVRLALIARNTDPNDAEGIRPVVVEEMTAEVEFNRARVARYRPIGFEGRPLSLARIGEEPRALRAGGSCTVLFEVEPVGGVGDPGGAGQNRAGRYQGPAPAVGEDELLTVSVSFREPAAEARRSITLHVIDTITPMDEAPNDVRLASALGWLGLVIQGGIEGDQESLDRIKALAKSTDEGFLPGVRDELGNVLTLIEKQLAGNDQPIP